MDIPATARALAVVGKVGDCACRDCVRGKEARATAIESALRAAQAAARLEDAEAAELEFEHTGHAVAAWLRDRASRLAQVK